MACLPKYNMVKIICLLPVISYCVKVLGGIRSERSSYEIFFNRIEISGV